MRIGLVAVLILVGCDSRVTGFRLTAKVPVDPDGFSNALYQSVGVRLAPGHDIELVDNGKVFSRLEQEIGKAKTSVNMVLFIWRPTDPSPRIVNALVARAKEGVACRILVDAVASTGFEDDVKPQLVAAGCDVRAFRPRATQDRNHRKIVVVDGTLGFTGGFGIDKPWLGDGKKPDEWRESNLIVKGPAVNELQQAFADNWQEMNGPLLPASDFPAVPAAGPTRAAYVSSTGSAHLTKADRLSQLTIAAATKRLWIANAYFVPSPGMSELLIEKKRQGVDVQIMAPSDNTDHQQVLREQRATYGKLLEAGIRIWEYQPSLLHSKTMVVDDHLSVLGSINLDRLSLNAMEEGSLVMSDPHVVEELTKTWEADLLHCKEIKK